MLFYNMLSLNGEGNYRTDRTTQLSPDVQTWDCRKRRMSKEWDAQCRQWLRTRTRVCRSTFTCACTATSSTRGICRNTCASLVFCRSSTTQEFSSTTPPNTFAFRCVAARRVSVHTKWNAPTWIFRQRDNQKRS